MTTGSGNIPESAPDSERPPLEQEVARVQVGNAFNPHGATIRKRQYGVVALDLKRDGAIVIAVPDSSEPIVVVVDKCIEAGVKRA